MRALLTIFAFVFITSCTATGPTFSEKSASAPALRPEPGKALVFVYRASQFRGSGLPSPFLDNGKQVGTLNPGGYITHHVEPGLHEFRTDVYVVDEPLSLTTSEGKTYYLKVYVEGH